MCLTIKKYFKFWVAVIVFIIIFGISLIPTINQSIEIESCVDTKCNYNFYENNYCNITIYATVETKTCIVNEKCSIIGDTYCTYIKNNPCNNIYKSCQYASSLPLGIFFTVFSVLITIVLSLSLILMCCYLYIEKKRLLNITNQNNQNIALLEIEQNGCD